MFTLEILYVNSVCGCRAHGDEPLCLETRCVLNSHWLAWARVNKENDANDVINAGSLDPVLMMQCCAIL
jgi:hypothetical protein